LLTAVDDGGRPQGRCLILPVFAPDTAVNDV
jgi:hypothetical protein